MKTQRFLEHHGIVIHPFTDEDAQTDQVFKQHCILSTHHPAWDKIYGDPSEPSTAIVFGEKGAGKTALRLQVVKHLEQYNAEHPDRRVFVIEYDDFNPFLDRFSSKLPARQRRTDRLLQEWKLWDHMDAILSLGVTRLIDRLLDPPPGTSPAAHRLTRLQSRDLMLLASLYDQSLDEPSPSRWRRLRHQLRFSTWRSKWRVALGLAAVLLVAAITVLRDQWDWLSTPWPYLIALAGWIPWAWGAWRRWWQARAIARQLRVINREVNGLRRHLMKFTAEELSGQPLPTMGRTDDRYELLNKFLTILRGAGYSGAIVLIDRVDEPHLINGAPEQMRSLLWPLLDNKFLKHPGVGFKLLLPIELSYHIQREDAAFFQRARLDKQNMVPSLDWTGEALYDVANARLQACAAEGRSPKLRELFDASVSETRLIEALRRLRVPRHLFKLLHRVLVAHCNLYTDEQPAWKISAATFDATLTLYLRDQEAFDRGVGAG
ncbi:MAG: hypothetical protein K1X74_11780 [Pirellulales bacterium]|nr:hypothetical protein [Pirellulales bacterium]